MIKALTIAGSDSGGGAGIQADLKTFSALGCYGMSVITAVTAQNTQGVSAVHPVPPEVVGQQIDAVLSDLGADAVKLGMLFSRAIMERVAQGLKQWAPSFVVVDPVMIAKGGTPLIDARAVEFFKASILPLATVLTPNLPEASALLGRAVVEADQMEEAARQLTDLGPAWVLLKGGHLPGDSCLDVLYGRAQGQVVSLVAPRIPSPNTHGTGCTLAAALACFLAKGHSAPESAQLAKSYLSGALKAGAGLRLGKGIGPVHHFYELWP